MNTHQVLIIVVVDTRIFGCVADSLQERRFASISPTNYKNTKMSIFRSEIVGITVVHGRCGLRVKKPRGNAAVEYCHESLMADRSHDTDFGYSLDLTNLQGKQYLVNRYYESAADHEYLRETKKKQSTTKHINV